MRPYMMWLLWRTRNTVQKFCWKHIYDHRANIHHVPGLRVHSTRTQPVSLRKMMFTVRQIYRHKPTKITAHTALSHLQGAQTERMTVRHHPSMIAIQHLVFSCCISHSLSHCLWWRLHNILSLVHGQSWQGTSSPTWCNWHWNVCIFGKDNINGTFLTRQTVMVFNVLVVLFVFLSLLVTL
jgi:hypothetical protein